MPKKTNSLALVSAILGVLGILGMLPFIGSVGAIVCGHISRGQIAQDPAQDGGSYATLGLVTGYLGVVLGCMGIALAVAWFGGLAALMAFVGLAGG